MPDGKRISGKRFMAGAVWQIVTEGRVTMPDGRTWTVEPSEWLGVVKWVYLQVDGPAKQSVDVTSNDEPLGNDISPTERVAAMAAAFEAIRDSLSTRDDAGAGAVEAVGGTAGSSVLDKSG